MDLPAFADDVLQVDIGTIACRQAGIESGRGFASCFTDLIGLERTLDDVGYRAIFAPRKSMGKVACLGAAY